MASEFLESVPSFDYRHYVPCVRWKLGEYQAILRLTPETKGLITPLIEVPEAGWDFEKRKEMKTVDQRLGTFAKRVGQKWGRGACFVDLSLFKPSDRMLDGKHPVEYAFADLRAYGCKAVPVTGCDRDSDYQTAIKEVVRRDGRGACIRLSLKLAVGRDVKKSVSAVLRELHLDAADADMVLDLDAPANFVPVDGFVKLLLKVLDQLPYRDRWRTFTVIGTSFPSTMGDLERGAQMVMRYEWIAYKKLTDALRREKRRVPTFGDYCISHPQVPQIDMRIVKPAASIRYTVDDAWYILKGKNVRDHKFTQYRQLCQAVVSSGHFGGRSRSEGDAYIEDCAKGRGKTGNLTTWRRVGTNRHIEKVVLDIANLFAS